MALLDYKVFQHCGVLVIILFQFFLIGSGVSFDNVYPFPNCVLDHIILKFSFDASEHPPPLSFSFPTLLSSIWFTAILDE